MRRLLTLSLLSLGLVSLVGCGDGMVEAPPGFNLRINLRSIDPQVISQVTVTVTPDLAMGQQFEQFDPPEAQIFEGGAFEVEVLSNPGEAGVLVVRIAGDEIRENIVATGGGGLGGLYDFEFWTPDTNERLAGNPPQVRVNALRAGEVIGRGAVFLPGWPLPSPEEAVDQLPSSVTVQVECTSEAASAGRCVP